MQRGYNLQEDNKVDHGIAISIPAHAMPIQAKSVEMVIINNHANFFPFFFFKVEATLAEIVLIRNLHMGINLKLFHKYFDQNIWIEYRTLCSQPSASKGVSHIAKSFMLFTEWGRNDSMICLEQTFMLGSYDTFFFFN